MKQHLWLLDNIENKYTCFPHGKFGDAFCHGCGATITEDLLRHVPMHTIPDEIIEGRREGGPQLIAALDWIQFKHAKNELPLMD